MPRTAARPGPPSITLGVWGQGETDAENIEALLTDYIDGLDGEHTVKVLIPLDKDLSSDTILDVAAVVAEQDGWELHVIQTAPPRTKVLREIKESAAKTIESSTEDIEADFIKALETARDARLLFLWAENDEGEPDEDDQRLLFAVMDAGVQCLDLTSGLDVLDAEGGEEAEAEPEPEKPAKKGKAAAKEAEPEPEADGEGDDDGPSEEEIRGWSERRLRKYAVECGMAPDEADALKKAALLSWIFEEDEPPAEEEPEAEPEKPRKGREIRKEIEAEGGSVPKPIRGRQKAAESPEEHSDEAQAGVAPSGALAGADESLVREILGEVGNLIADIIIDRIAERIKAEPEKSPVREEIAPTRPPGRPRGDGGAPTRRRTAK